MTALGEPDNCICGRTVTGSASCPEHPREPVLFDPIPITTELTIPEGVYCYEHTGRVRIQNRVFDREGGDMQVPYYFAPDTETCPYWNRTDDGGAYCARMGKYSEYQDPDSLIWDQIKECEEDDEPYNLFELEEMRSDPATPLDRALKHAKKYPEFIQSLVGILLDSEVNEFKYDGVIYTLSRTIWREN